MANNPNPNIGVPKIRLEPAPVGNTGPVDRQYISALGPLEIKVVKEIVFKYGLSYRWLPAIFEKELHLPKQTLSNSRIAQKKGVDIIYPGSVISTVNPPAGFPNAGFQTVQLKVRGPNGRNQTWWGKGTQISSTTGGGRQFSVVSEPTVDPSDGFQIITVMPNDENYNLSFDASGMCEQFPDDTPFGYLGDIGIDGASRSTGSLDDCTDNVPDRIIDDRTSYSNEFSRYVAFQYVNRATMQEKWYTLDVIADGIDDFRGYVNEKDLQHIAMMQMASNYNMFYGKGRPIGGDSNLQIGDGLLHQIPSDFLYNYVPGQLTYNRILNIMLDYLSQFDGYIAEGATLDWWCGTDAFFEIQNMLATEQRTGVQYLEPRPKGHALDKKDAGTEYENMYFVQGYWVRLHQMKAFQELWGLPIPSPISNKRSIRSHDIFMTNLNPVRNFNLESGEFHDVPGLYNIALYGQKTAQGGDMSFFETQRTGLIDYSGNIMRVAPEFRNNAAKRTEMNMMLFQHNDTASAYISPLA